MSYNKTIKYAGLDIHFEYSFDGEMLICDVWSAYLPGSNEELLIPDQDFSEEIEDEIVAWLDAELYNNDMNYRSDWRSRILDNAFDRYMDR